MTTSDAAAPRASSRVSSGATLALGIYLVLGSLLLAYAIFELWPISEEAESGEVVVAEAISFFGGEFGIKYESRLILLVLAVGALGSFVHTATSFTTYVGNRSLVESWLLFYWLRPFIGMALALIFYFVIRGGLLSAGAPAEDVSVFGISAIAGLVGMFSKQATDKLRELFDNLFKTEAGQGDDQRRDKVGGNLPVTEAMIPANLITAYTIKEGRTEADVAIGELVDLLKGVVTRVPVLDDEGVARYVIHQSLVFRYISESSLALAEQGQTFDRDSATLRDLLDSGDTRALVERALAYVPITATIVQAKQAMDAKKSCQDVLVTDTGGEAEPLRGWLTNVDITKHTQA